MSAPVPANTLDRRAVRRSFERAAATTDAVAVLQREVSARMAERLGVLRLAPTAIVDAGCGTGESMGELLTRYPEARLVGVDVALAMTRAAQARASGAATPGRSLLARLTGQRPAAASPLIVCGDIEAQPFHAASFDLAWSNLVLHWVETPEKAFAEFQRVLKVGGLLSFTMLGPDTLRELRRAFAAVDATIHVHRFFDMHDVGDMLVAAGFADPVMDMEVITLTYPDATALMRELKALGARNAAADRRRGLMGRARWARMLRELEASRQGDRQPASFEIVYGHAWKPEPRLDSDGRAIIRFGAR
ncbi:MAG: malonyl-ACP O-methyltransferase BioC [Betaproteobacteria bacterium]